MANAGDSRCVLCRKGTAVNMSEDHKPTNTLEHERITKVPPLPILRSLQETPYKLACGRTLEDCCWLSACTCAVSRAADVYGHKLSILACLCRQAALWQRGA